MARLDIVVSSLMPVFEGDMVRQKCDGGYILRPAPYDGIYVNADTPVISVDEAEDIINHIREQRREEIEAELAIELEPEPKNGKNGNGHSLSLGEAFSAFFHGAGRL